VFYSFVGLLMICCVAISEVFVFVGGTVPCLAVGHQLFMVGVSIKLSILIFGVGCVFVLSSVPYLQILKYWFMCVCLCSAFADCLPYLVHVIFFQCV
jgi:hypothetical protein